MGQRAKMSDRKFNSRCDNAGLAPCLTREALAVRALDEARAILAETEPASGASVYCAAAFGGDLVAGSALAEALRAFVEA